MKRARWRGQRQELGDKNKYPEPSETALTAWWSWRARPTRSHPELVRENAQRRWYCISRCGRAGRRQAFNGASEDQLSRFALRAVKALPAVSKGKTPTRTDTYGDRQTTRPKPLIIVRHDAWRRKSARTGGRGAWRSMPSAIKAMIQERAAPGRNRKARPETSAFRTNVLARDGAAR